MSRKPKQPEKGRNNPEKPEPADTPAIECEVIEAPRRGRPSKRTPELEAAIVECVRLGMTIPQTCDACGISQTQFRNWRKHYREFQDLIRQAEAEAVKLNLAVIQAAAASGKAWQAAAWFLERKHPEQWGKTETLSIEARKDAVKDALRIGPGRTPEQLRELRAILDLPRDTTPAIVEAAVDHAKAERLRRKQAEIFGTPFEPRPFSGVAATDKRPGLTGETLAIIEKLCGITGEDPRAERIAAIMELQAKARELAGKPPLAEAEAFEAAARELDHESGGTAGA